MDNRSVLYYDSGIGGLCYGLHFHARNPAEQLICVGDRANFPYGMKTEEELVRLTLDITEKIIAQYNPKLMALACNSASVSALVPLRERFPGLPIVGTIPAVKPAVLASKSRRVGILGTRRTNSSPHIEELAAKYGPDCVIEKIAAPELAEFMEHKWADASSAEKKATAESYIRRFREKGVDALVLACTHFPFLKDEFTAAAANDMAVFDSVEGITSRVESLLDADEGRLRADNSRTGATGVGAADGRIHADENRTPVRMAVTGEGNLEPYWRQLADRFALCLERI